ncbi:MAG: tail fiber domain-containing protein [Planctomycetota bacterium]
MKRLTTILAHSAVVMSAVALSAPAQAQGFGFTRICAWTVRDAAGTLGCVQASSAPRLGTLYPLGIDFNITPGGRAGFGTLAPVSTIHAIGTMTAEDPSNGRQVQIFGNGEIETPTGAMRLNRFSDRNVLLTQGGGNVGIGVTFPDTKLHVVGPIKAESALNGRTLELFGNGEIETPTSAMHLNRFSDRNVLLVEGGGNVGVGVTFPTHPLEMASGAHCSIGGTWTNASSVALKENFMPVDGAEVMERVASLAITRWNYRVDADEVQHVGPMAEDFAQAFGLAGTDRAISTVDADGVALVCIQELHTRLLQRDREVQALLARVEALEAAASDESEAEERKAD